MYVKSALLLLILLALNACKNEAPTDISTRIDVEQAKPNATTEATPTAEASATEVKPPKEKAVKKVRKPKAKFSFVDKKHEFGFVDEGSIVKHNFAFTNTGKIPLIIKNAETTCGCTVPEWPKEPIPPGESGIIKATFDTKGKLGSQNKEITIWANTHPSKTKIALVGLVGTLTKKKENPKENPKEEIKEKAAKIEAVEVGKDSI